MVGFSTLHPFSIFTATSHPRSMLGFCSKFDLWPPLRAHTTASTFYPPSHPTSGTYSPHPIPFLGKQRNWTAPITEHEHFRQSHQWPRWAVFQQWGWGFVWAWPYLSNCYPISAILFIALIKPYKASDFVIDTIHSRSLYILPRTGNCPKSSRLPDVECDIQMYLNSHNTLHLCSHCDYTLCSCLATSHVVDGHLFLHCL